MIELEDEVPVRPGLRLALKVLAGKRGKMNRLQGVKQEERLVGFLVAVSIEKLEALLQEDHVDFFVIEVGCDHAGATVKRPLVLRQRRLCRSICVGGTGMRSPSMNAYSQSVVGQQAVPKK